MNCTIETDSNLDRYFIDLMKIIREDDEPEKELENIYIAVAAITKLEEYF